MVIMLLEEGAELLVVGRRKIARRDLPRGVTYCQTDLNSLAALDVIEKKLDDLGWHTLDGLVLNAAKGFVGEFLDETPEFINEIVDTNVVVPMSMAHLLYARLELAGGFCLFVGSTATRKPAPLFATYSATKAGFGDLARNLGTEWQGRVDVLEVHPGPTRTDFHKKSGLENPPLAFLYMKPEEVARGILKSIKKRRRRVAFDNWSLLGRALLRLVAGGRS